MLISVERLYYTSESTGFRPEILEKVIYLIHLLNRFAEDPFLKNKFVLKGGTALNLFCFDYPRLSVDIDINYIGSSDRNVMLQEKSLVESAIENIVLDEKMIPKRKPNEHAGGKWLIRYPSALQSQGNIEIDLNYLDRVPLWPRVIMNSFKLGEFQANNIPVQDFHELASGKLRALFSRHSSRDLFDVHQLMVHEHLDIEKLRLGFMIYGGISRIDWRQIKPGNIHFDWQEFQNMLIPLLRKVYLANRDNPKLWAEKILNESKSALNKLFPLRENEAQFLDTLLEQGEINAALLTSDRLLQERIQSNLALLWKAENVRSFKGKNNLVATKI